MENPPSGLQFSPELLSLRSPQLGDPAHGSSPPNCSDSKLEPSKCPLPLLVIGYFPSHRNLANLRGFNTILGLVAPMISGSPETPKLGVNIAFIWGSLNVGCWAYVYFLIPELKGLTLE